MSCHQSDKEDIDAGDATNSDPVDEKTEFRLHAAEKYQRIVKLDTERVASSNRDERKILRFIEGIDENGPEEMSLEEVKRELNDPWAVTVLREGIFPKDIVEVLQEMTRLEDDPDSNLKRRSFLVGEGGQFAAQMANLDRSFRYVISWHRGNLDGVVFLSIPGGSRDGLTEMIAWDDRKESLNFYRREGTDTWVWRGDSRHAFDPRSAGRSCFGCHPNGNLLMKEQDRPWQNWHSELAGISSTVVPPAMRPDHIPELKALFDGRSKAQDLEAIIAKAIERSNLARIALRNGRIEGVRSLMRQVIETNNCNLRASEQKAIAANPTTRIGIPKELFFDHRAFDHVFDVNLPGFATPIPWPRYSDLLTELGFQFRSGPERIDGDTFFLSLVPTPAFEDSNLMNLLVRAGVITRKFALCITMVDFPNPVFSETRNTLLDYLEDVPDTVEDSDLLAAQVRFAKLVMEEANRQGMSAEEALDSATAEQQFGFYWSLPEADFSAKIETHLAEFLEKARIRSQTEDGQHDILKFIALRRNQYDETLPGSEQAEFDLLFPHVDSAIESARMQRDGTIQFQP